MKFVGQCTQNLEPERTHRHVLFLWPWPWSDDLDVGNLPKYSEDVPVYQTEVSRSRLSKVRSQTGQTDKRIITLHLRVVITLKCLFLHNHCSTMYTYFQYVNPFTADHVNALHFAILV